MKFSDYLSLVEKERAKKAPTIRTATMANGEINRKTSDAIIDPKGFFKKNKSKK